MNMNVPGLSIDVFLNTNVDSYLFSVFVAHLCMTYIFALY